MGFRDWHAWVRWGIYGIIFDVGLYALGAIIKLIGLATAGPSAGLDYIFSLFFLINTPIPLPIITAIFVPLLINIKDNGWGQLPYRNKFGVIFLLIAAASAILGFIFQIQILMIPALIVLFVTPIGELSDGGGSGIVTIAAGILLISFICYIVGYIIGMIFDKTRQRAR